MAVQLAGDVRLPRHAPVKRQIYLGAVDMSGASTLAAQVRLEAEAAGSSLIDLATVTTVGSRAFASSTSIRAALTRSASSSCASTRP